MPASARSAADYAGPRESGSIGADVPPPSETDFPEHPLWGCYRRAHEWTPDGLGRLLDAGCAWGYGTCFFRTKAREVHGLDPNGEAVEVARTRYPELSFVESVLERTPFPDGWFDVVVSCETLEHVRSEVDSFSEIHRILRPGGLLVLTTPHRGLLAFMDPDNWASSLLVGARRRWPRLHRLYKRALAAHRDTPAHVASSTPPPEARHEHRHYTVRDLRKLLDRSAFGGEYEIDRVFRSGFLVEMVLQNLYYVFGRVLPGRLRRVVSRLFGFLIGIDYRIPYGAVANRLAVRIVKRPPV